MGSIPYTLALEIDAAELVASHENVTLAGTVEDRNTIFSAHLDDGVHNLLTVAPLEIFAAPRSEEQYLCRRIFLNKSLAQCRQSGFERVHTNGVESAAVVMSTDNEHIVE